MKIVVTEMPISRHVCPFLREYTTRFFDEEMNHQYKVLCYHCTVTKDMCDLDNNVCSGLKVLEV